MIIKEQLVSTKNLYIEYLLHSKVHISQLELNIHVADINKNNNFLIAPRYCFPIIS